MCVVWRRAPRGTAAPVLPSSASLPARGVPGSEAGRGRRSGPDRSAANLAGNPSAVRGCGVAVGRRRRARTRRGWSAQPRRCGLPEPGQRTGAMRGDRGSGGGRHLGADRAPARAERGCGQSPLRPSPARVAPAAAGLTVCTRKGQISCRTRRKGPSAAAHRADTTTGPAVCRARRFSSGDRI